MVTGVSNVTANGRVCPGLVAVAKKAQVQLDQKADCLDAVVVETQFFHALLGELRANQIVVIERDPAARLELAGRRLANIVHQGGETQNEVGL